MRKMKLHRLSAKHILIIALLIVHLTPIWVIKYFPTQDGSTHIYNSYILKEYHKEENFKLREVYRLNLTLFPNWTSHALMMLLMYIFPPIICEKILLSLCIVLPPLSLFYFLGAVDKDKMVFGFLGFIYAFNYLLHMGFYNFALSIPMFFFSLGYWWKHKSDMNLHRLGVLYLLLFITYFCHFQSYFLVLLTIFFLALFGSLYSASTEMWGHQNGRSTREKLKILVGKLKTFLTFMGYMLPAYFIMISYSLTKSVGYERSYRSFEDLLQYFINMKSLVCYNDNRIIIMQIMLGLLGVAFLLTIWDRIRSARGSDKSTGRLWTKIINGKESFLMTAVVLTVVYFKSPGGVGSGGGWINDRVHIYIFLVLLPFLSVGFRRYMRYAIAGIIIALSLWHLSYNAHTYYYLSKETAEMTETIGELEDHTTLSMNVSVWDGAGQRTSDHLGPFKYVSPFLFVYTYNLLGKDIAFLSNYEAEHNYFPIDYKHGEEGYPEPPDYIALSRRENNETFAEVKELQKLEQLEALKELEGPERAKALEELEKLEKMKDEYALVSSGKHYKIYRRRTSNPKESSED